jgi:hypothetical protein
MPTEAEAQQALLDSLLGGTPLPGTAQPLVFPDAPDLAAGRRVLLGDERGAGGLDVPDRVRVVGRDGLAAAARTGGDAAVLEFLPPEELPGVVGARLRISVPDRDGRLLALGEVVASFHEADELRATEPTHVLSY